MKIYVITKGEYSDYHICGVAVDKAEAKILARGYSDNWDEARIEEYDTDNLSPVLEGKTAYRVTFFRNGDVYQIDRRSIEYFEPGVMLIPYPKNWNGATLHVFLYADDEKSAIKIAAEKRAKFLAEKLDL